MASKLSAAGRIERVAGSSSMLLLLSAQAVNAVARSSEIVARSVVLNFVIKELFFYIFGAVARNAISYKDKNFLCKTLHNPKNLTHK